MKRVILGNVVGLKVGSVVGLCVGNNVGWEVGREPHVKDIE